MNAPPRLVIALLACAALFAGADRAAAQLPFDIKPEQLLKVDTAAIKWTRLSTYVGGAEAALIYRVQPVTIDDCKAVAFLAVRRLRNYFQKEGTGDLISLRLRLECGPQYRGSLDYDGVTVQLDLRERSSGDLVYRGRHHGLP